MLDLAGIIRSWNPGAEQLTGYAACDIIGKHFSCLYSNEDREAGLPEQALRTAAIEGKFGAEAWRIRQDGSRFWAYVVIDPIIGQSGKIEGYTQIIRDFTERRKSDADMRTSEERFRLLVHGVTDYAIYFLSPEGNVTSWNSGAERIKGYTPDEIIGRNFSRFYTTEEREKDFPKAALAKAKADGRFEAEGWRVRKDGTHFLAHVIIDRLCDDDGKHIGFAKITRDITERQRAAKQLEATREIFFQSQKQQAIGQLTGGVAHDFNNLLMAILGSLELMRKRIPNDERLRALLENAVKAVERGSALVKRMLMFARRQELQIRPIEIPALVRDMSELLQRSLGPSMTLETHFPPSIRPILADANQLEMALLNLCVNARDAMPDGGRIDVAARDVHVKELKDTFVSPGNYVCISVTDTGSGMDAPTLAHATEPFFTTKGTGKGTGLGLSMVHGFVEQSGGLFKLSSEPGEGTRAEMWFPVASQQPEERIMPIVADLDGQQSTLRVIAVDDDPLILMNTEAMLEDLGHICFSAKSANEAIETLKRERNIDVVVTDQAMPQMTGLQLADVIRKNWPDVSVILATGYAEIEPGNTLSIRKLSKPFTEIELAKELAKVSARLTNQKI